jgi:hypothetical protein
MTGLKIKTNGEVPSTNSLAFGQPSDGSRVIQWGWNPVGLNNPLAFPDLPNTLLSKGQVGTVTVQTTPPNVGIFGVSLWGAAVFGTGV